SALIGNVFIDVVTRMSLSAPKSVTTHPIEDGSEIGEHVVDLPETLTLDVVATDNRMAPVGEAAATMTTTTTAADKREAVLRIKDMRQLVTVDLQRGNFPNMVLLDVIEDVTHLNSLVFQATLVFQHVKLAQTLTVQVPLDKLLKKSAAKTKAGLKQVGTADKGTQPAEPAEDISALLAALQAAGVVG
ncbi:MAG TPA: hypothetical protein VJ553_06915, partial [Candidatus Paceibacterota bacterium]|nr:hypothetical protein [Candidatus Paceibacterota bacterium]